MYQLLSVDTIIVCKRDDHRTRANSVQTAISKITKLLAQHRELHVEENWWHSCLSYFSIWQLEQSNSLLFTSIPASLSRPWDVSVTHRHRRSPRRRRPLSVTGPRSFTSDAGWMRNAVSRSAFSHVSFTALALEVSCCIWKIAPACRHSQIVC